MTKIPKPIGDIPNPPAVLYVDGTLPDIENYAAIAVVGTRKASSIPQRRLALCQGRGTVRCSYYKRRRSRR
ncbi:MAG: DNA-processing protein DprA [Eubacterium sp.]